MSDTTTLERVLKVPEVASHLGVDRELVYRLISTGELRAIRLGRVLRIPESAVAEFISRGA